MKTYLLAIFCLLLLGGKTNAQDFEIVELTEEINYVMLFDSQDRLWYSDGTNIVMYDGEFHKQEVLALKDKNQLWEDSDGNIWGNSSKGFVCFKGGEILNFPHKDESFIGSHTVMDFQDRQGRLYFFNQKPAYNGGDRYISLAVFEDGEFKYLKDNLPESINNVTEYKDGAVFGDQDVEKPCGYYDGNYELVSEGGIYDFYYSLKGILTSDASKLETPDMFLKYDEIKHTTPFGEQLLLLADQKALVYSRQDNAIQEIQIPEEHLGFTEEIILTLFYANDAFYVVSLDKGVLEIKSDGAKLYNKKSGLPDNNVKFFFKDKNGHLVLMHPKAASVLADGEWKHFDEDNGYDLKDLHIASILNWKDAHYVSAYNTEMGKGNKLLCWDGEKWKSFDFETKYRYTSRIKPFVYKDHIWYFHHNGNTYRGLMHFNGEQFTEFPLGKKLKDNWVKSVSCTKDLLYVHTSGLGKGVLFLVK